MRSLNKLVLILPIRADNNNNGGIWLGSTSGLTDNESDNLPNATRRALEACFYNIEAIFMLWLKFNYGTSMSTTGAYHMFRQLVHTDIVI